MACALIDGAVRPDQVLEDNLADPAHRSLSARVEIAHDPGPEKAFPKRALARVEVESSDGRRAGSGVLAARGDAESPLSRAEMAKKFRSLCDPVLGPDHAEELFYAIQELPKATDLGVALRHLQMHDAAPGAA